MKTQIIPEDPKIGEECQIGVKNYYWNGKAWRIIQAESVMQKALLSTKNETLISEKQTILDIPKPPKKYNFWQKAISYIAEVAIIAAVTGAIFYYFFILK